MQLQPREKAMALQHKGNTNAAIWLTIDPRLIV